MQKYIYIYMLDTYRRNELIRRKDNDKDARRKTQEDFFYNIYLSLYCKGSKRFVWGFTVRGSWRPNINCNILTPNLWPSRCVFLVLWCSTGGPEPTLLDADFLYCILSASSLDPKLHRDSRGPLGRVWLSLPPLLSNCLALQLLRVSMPFRPDVAFLTTSRLQLAGTQLATPLAAWLSNTTGTGTQFNWLVELNWVI